MSLTVKKLQIVEWKKVYDYAYNDKGAGFQTYSSEIPNVTITHDRKIGASRTLIYYTVHGKRTDSPAQVCRWWNETAAKSGGSDATDGAQPAGRPGTRPVRRRGDQRA